MGRGLGGRKECELLVEGMMFLAAVARAVPHSICFCFQEGPVPVGSAVPPQCPHRK